jgi:small-conductance mechanosensitive channel
MGKSSQKKHSAFSAAIRPFSLLFTILFFMLITPAHTESPTSAKEGISGVIGNSKNSADSSELKTFLTQINTLKLDLNRIETFIQNKKDTSRPELLTSRNSLEKFSDQLADILKAVTPRIESLQELINQFGPKPAEGETPESPAITQERDKKLALLKDFEQVAQLSRALLVQAQQILTEIDTRRRNLFAQEFFSQSASILSPTLWTSAIHALPITLSAATNLFKDWILALVLKTSQFHFLTFILEGLLGLILFSISTFFYRKWVVSEWSTIEIPSKILCVSSALKLIALILTPIVLGGLLIYGTLFDLELIPSRIDKILTILFIGIILIAFVYAFSEGLFAPRRPKWRLIPMQDSTAHSLQNFSIRSTFIFFLGRLLEVIEDTVGADLSLILLTKGIFATILGLYCLSTLYRLNSGLGASDSEDRRVPLESPFVLPMRMLAWVAGSVFVLAPIFGYSVFAIFLEKQAIILAVCSALFVIGRLIVEYGLSPLFTVNRQVGRFLLSAFRIQKNHLDVIRILIASILKLILMGFVLLPLLTLWGIEWQNILGNLKVVFTGIRIGELTISLSAIFVAILTFIITLTVTRMLQRWLTTQLLPATSLDSALRNSITMVFGYVGMFLAFTLGLFQLGFGLDKIALLAGGLSVGIGFSLKPIVENFISGLILLWERFVRVGDWVSIGPDEGLVKRITMRGTEIETFERAEIIVPNVNLISGTVKNWLRTDQMGRISIFVSVDYGSDPKKVASILLECAKEHPLVLTKPEPDAFLKAFGESAIEFELQCFISKIPSRAAVKSDLHFSIFSSFSDSGIEFAWPRRQLHVTRLDSQDLNVPEE